ncbi:MAG: hypothetical protein K2M44_03000 [Clostridia bacterium]|nr:hypothetical protein [Clostridia bacterium]
MRDRLKLRHKIATGIAVAIYIAYFITWVTLEATGQDRDLSGGKAHYWAYALCTLALAFMLFLMFKPDAPFISRNINDGNRDRFIALRRNTLGICMIAVVVGCFGMAISWMMGLRFAYTTAGQDYDLYTKIGIVELFGILMMSVIAVTCTVYFVKARSILIKETAASHMPKDGDKSD